MLLAVDLVFSVEVSILGTLSTNTLQADTSDKVSENRELYARHNLALLEVLKEIEIFLINIEEVKEVMKKISCHQNSGDIRMKAKQQNKRQLWGAREYYSLLFILLYVHVVSVGIGFGTNDLLFQNIL